MVRCLVLAIILASAGAPALAQQTTTLVASDGLKVTADVYGTDQRASGPWIVLAHQAASSRGEYRTIAPRLNRLGFNAIAIDQRSGKSFGGVANATARRAGQAGKRRSYLAARPDIVAAVAWARSQTTGKVVLWGSSYSAALAFLVASDPKSRVDAVVAMSPGEYIRGMSIAGAAAKLDAPVLITSPASERKRWRRILQRIPHNRKVGFAPRTGGRHGSSALIASRNTSSKAYWSVVERFLADYVQP
ncbi:MAG: alpha/beta fold hydrolase [Pseudomonadota bacterium]